MKRACIAIVDAASARLYTFEHEAAPQDQLREVADLTNAGRRLRDSELFSDSRPGLRSDGKMANSGHAVDDHRDAHLAHFDAEFAKTVVAEIEKIVNTGAYAHVIIVASPKMLGELRKCNGALHRADLVLDEIQRDLARLTSPQIHDHLARLNLIPPRQRLAFEQGAARR